MVVHGGRMFDGYKSLCMSVRGWFMNCTVSCYIPYWMSMKEAVADVLAAYLLVEL